MTTLDITRLLSALAVLKVLMDQQFFYSVSVSHYTGTAIILCGILSVAFRGFQTYLATPSYLTSPPQ